MYLLKSFKGELMDQSLPSLADAAMPSKREIRPLFKSVGEEKPYSIGTLLLTLILLLHLWAATWVLQSAEPLIAAKPMLMEVTLIAAPALIQKPVVAPAAKPKPVELKKDPVKKLVKQKKAIIRKKIEPPKPQEIVEESIPEPATTKATPAPIALNVAEGLSNKVMADSELFIEANFSVNYGSNPKPKYPRIAANRGWQGTVLLLVRVSVEGDSKEISIQRSSGHESLDEAAIEAVERWKFIPAKRGDTPVSSLVVVPISFILNN